MNTERAHVPTGISYATPKNGQIVAVNSGHFREWPSERGAVSTAEDRRGQMDTTATLEAARELEELAPLSAIGCRFSRSRLCKRLGSCPF